MSSVTILVKGLGAGSACVAMYDTTSGNPAAADPVAFPVEEGTGAISHTASKAMCSMPVVKAAIV